MNKILLFILFFVLVSSNFVKKKRTLQKAKKAFGKQKKMIKNPEKFKKYKAEMITCILENDKISATLKKFVEAQKESTEVKPFKFSTLNLDKSDKTIIKTCRQDIRKKFKTEKKELKAKLAQTSEKKVKKAKKVKATKRHLEENEFNPSGIIACIGYLSPLYKYVKEVIEMIKEKKFNEIIGFVLIHLEEFKNAFIGCKNAIIN